MSCNSQISQGPELHILPALGWNCMQHIPPTDLTDTGFRAADFCTCQQEVSSTGEGLHNCGAHFKSLKTERNDFCVQVNIAGRPAAIAPGSADNLAAFAGVYQTHNLPEVAGKPADAGFELSISVGADGEPQKSCIPIGYM